MSASCFATLLEDVHVWVPIQLAHVVVCLRLLASPIVLHERYRTGQVWHAACRRVGRERYPTTRDSPKRQIFPAIQLLGLDPTGQGQKQWQWPFSTRRCCATPPPQPPQPHARSPPLQPRRLRQHERHRGHDGHRHHCRQLWPTCRQQHQRHGEAARSSQWPHRGPAAGHHRNHHIRSGSSAAAAATAAASTNDIQYFT